MKTVDPMDCHRRFQTRSVDFTGMVSSTHTMETAKTGCKNSLCVERFTPRSVGYLVTENHSGSLPLRWNSRPLLIDVKDAQSRSLYCAHTAYLPQKPPLLVRSGVSTLIPSQPRAVPLVTWLDTPPLPYPKLVLKTRDPFPLGG